MTTRASGPLYFYKAPLNYDKTKIYVDGKRVKTSNMNVYKAATLRLGHFKKNQKVEVKILTGRTFDLNPEYFQSLDQPKFLKSLSKFQNNSLKISSNLNHDTVRGTIDVKKAGPMLFSIPYDDGWSATVDGKKTRLHQVVDNLMAIDLDKGKHKVELNYQVPGLKIGWIISIVSVILFISFNFLKYRVKKYN